MYLTELVLVVVTESNIMSSLFLVFFTLLLIFKPSVPAPDALFCDYEWTAWPEKTGNVDYQYASTACDTIGSQPCLRFRGYSSITSAVNEINATNHHSLYIQFSANFVDVDMADELYIETSDNGGNNWDRIATYMKTGDIDIYVNETVNFSSSADGQNDLQIKFISGASSSTDHLYIDNVCVYGMFLSILCQNTMIHILYALYIRNS